MWDLVSNNNNDNNNKNVQGRGRELDLGFPVAYLKKSWGLAKEMLRFGFPSLMGFWGSLLSLLDSDMLSFCTQGCDKGGLLPLHHQAD